MNGNGTTDIQRIVTESNRNSAKYSKVVTPVTVTIESHSPHSPKVIVPTSPDIIIDIDTDNSHRSEEHEPIMKLPERIKNNNKNETELQTEESAHFVPLESIV